MTDLTVTSTAFQSEKRSWLASKHGTDYTPSGTLDVSKFTAGTHYPNGFLPSGTVVGAVTATGLLGPYNDAATDGTQTAVGVTFGSATIRNGSTKVGVALLVHGAVRRSKLPFTAGTTGAIDTAGETDLKHIIFTA